MKIQQDIGQWCDETFGAATPLVSAIRTNEEMAELLKAVLNNDPNSGEECADVLICLYRLACNLGIDLDEEAIKKMKINKNRTWEIMGNGTAYHVKGK